MSQQRWDVKLVFLNGPLSVRGEQVIRGPVIRIGARPGPGGFALENYRGIEDRQVTITAYDGDARIAPVGTAQVRLAGHEHVDWNEVHPLRGEAHLSPNCAFHLGPIGRGVTVRFVDCQQLGVWQQENLLSIAAKEEIQGPAPVEAKEIQAGTGVPGWFIGGIVMIAMVIVAGITVPLVVSTMEEAEPLGPEYMGEVLDKRAFVQASDTENLDPLLLERFEQPWLRFVAGPNAEYAGDDILTKPEYFDQKLLKLAQAYAEKQLKHQAFWIMLERSKNDYAAVIQAMRDAGAPEVLAGIPIVEAGYIVDNHDKMACASGAWQFQPEVAKRYGLRVKGCKLRGSSELWEPTDIVAPRNLLKGASYVENIDGKARCKIAAGGCRVDERNDIDLATEAAIRSFREPLEDERILESGAAVQLAITSHNAGYDDARHRGQDTLYKTNVLGAYLNWIERKNESWDPRFLGEQVRCPPGTWASKCAGTTLNGYAQHYAYKVLGAHFVAVCYYALNHAEDYPVFRAYEFFLEDNGYCNRIAVPTVDAVKSYR